MASHSRFSASTIRSHPHQFHPKAHILSHSPINHPRFASLHLHKLSDRPKGKLEIMNVLDSPLEALAFNYLYFALLTVVHNLWTWVAVITAAVSFWRLRAAASLNSGSRAPLLDRDTVGCQPASALPASDSTEEPPIASASDSPVVTAVCAGEADGVTKAKFTVYYEDDGELMVAGEWDDGNEVEGFGESREWCEDWERMMRRRMGDLGWYSFQDTRVHNGNVVRLWEGCRGRSSIPGCVVWQLS